MSEEEKLQLENECLLKYSKARMIQKYIDELEKNIVLSNLWCKSQEENKKLNNIIDELEKELKNRIKNVPDTMAEVYEDKSILAKLQKLKGSDKG